jgi:hypothetical protein
VGEAINRHLDELIAAYPANTPDGMTRLLDSRYARFRNIGAWRDEQIP